MTNWIYETIDSLFGFLPIVGDWSFYAKIAILVIAAYLVVPAARQLLERRDSKIADRRDQYRSKERSERTVRFVFLGMCLVATTLLAVAVIEGIQRDEIRSVLGSVKGIFQWIPVFGDWSFYVQAGLILLVSLVGNWLMGLTGPFDSDRGFMDSSLPTSDRVATGILRVTGIGITVLPLLLVVALLSDLSTQTLTIIVVCIGGLIATAFMAQEG